MHVQPYNRVEALHPIPPRAPGDGNGSYVNGNGHSANFAKKDGEAAHKSHRPEHPTMLQVAGKLIWERRKLLGIWLIATGVLSALVIANFGKPIWRAEGTLLHSPEYNVTGGRRFYNPVSIQSVLTLVKSPEVLEKLKNEFNLPDSIEDLQNKTNINIAKQSEFISVSLDWPIREQCVEIANRLLTLSVEQYSRHREKLVHEATTAATNAATAEFEQLKTLQKQLNARLRENQVGKLAEEISADRLDVLAARTALRKEQSDQQSLQTQLQTAMDKLASLSQQEGTVPKVDGPLTTEEANLLLGIRMAQQDKRARLQNQRKTQMAIKYKKEEYDAIYTLWLKGFASTQEKNKLHGDLKALEFELDLDKDLKRELEELEKTEKKIFESARKRSTLPIQQAQIRVDELKQQLSACPGKIMDAEADLKAKVASLQKKEDLQLELQPLEDAIAQKKKDADNASQNKQQHDYLLTPNSADLRITSEATLEPKPRSTNSMKLAVGTFAVSMSLFLCYIFLVAMPRHSADSAEKPISTSPSVHPVNLPVLSAPEVKSASVHSVGLPVLSAPEVNGNGSHTSPPTPKPPAISDAIPETEQPQEAEEAEFKAFAPAPTPSLPERGAIVLFTPANGQIPIESIVTDLASQFAELGDRVLVFDARNANFLVPEWTGPNAPNIENRVVQYLEGTTDRVGVCFTSTRLASVDYSQADLTEYLDGIFSTYRFRKMTEEMRDRYSLVLMMTPDRELLGEGNEYLTAIAEGVVMVVNEGTSPKEVEGHIHKLRSSDSHTYGAVLLETT